METKRIACHVSNPLRQFLAVATDARCRSQIALSFDLPFPLLPVTAVGDAGLGSIDGSVRDVLSLLACAVVFVS